MLTALLALALCQASPDAPNATVYPKLSASRAPEWVAPSYLGCLPMSALYAPWQPRAVEPMPGGGYSMSIAPGQAPPGWSREAFEATLALARANRGLWTGGVVSPQMRRSIDRMRDPRIDGQ